MDRAVEATGRSVQRAACPGPLGKLPLDRGPGAQKACELTLPGGIGGLGTKAAGDGRRCRQTCRSPATRPGEGRHGPQRASQSLDRVRSHQRQKQASRPRLRPRRRLLSRHRGPAAAALPTGLSPWRRSVCWLRWARPTDRRGQLAWHLGKGRAGSNTSPESGQMGRERTGQRATCQDRPSPKGCCPVPAKRDRAEGQGRQPSGAPTPGRALGPACWEGTRQEAVGKLSQSPCHTWSCEEPPELRSSPSPQSPGAPSAERAPPTRRIGHSPWQQPVHTCFEWFLLLTEGDYNRVQHDKESLKQLPTHSGNLSHTQIAPA